MRKKYLKIISSVLIFQMLFLSMPKKAEAIPTTVIADIPFLVQLIKEIIEIAIFSAAKKAAIKQINKEVGSKIGQGKDGPAFITDWRDALQVQPERATQAQLNNFFTTLGKGRNGNYVSSDGTTSYAGSMLGVAQQSVLDMSLPQVLNLADYGVNDPAKVLNQKNLRAFMTAYGSSGGIGNSAEAMLVAQDAKARYEAINNRLAEAQAIANGGYYPVMANGQVITPGSSIRDLMASAQDMNFVAIASASTIKEVVASMVTRVVSQAVSKGFAKAKKEVKDTTGANLSSVISGADGAYDAYNQGVRSSFGNLNAR